MAGFEDNYDLSGYEADEKPKKDFGAGYDLADYKSEPQGIGIQPTPMDQALQQVGGISQQPQPEQVITQETKGIGGPVDEYTGLEFGHDIGKVFYDLPTTVLGSVAGAIEGDDPSYDPEDTTYQWREAARLRGIQRQEEAKARASEGEKFGIFSPEDVAATSGSAGFSAVAAGAGLAGGAAGFFTPVPGGAAMGAVAATLPVTQRMGASQFLGNAISSINDSVKEQTGKDLTPEQKQIAVGYLQESANESGWWEAIPETVGNVAGFKILASPIKGAVKKAMAKILGKKASESLPATALVKLGKLYGVELGTETITEMGQYNVNIEAGLAQGEKRSFTSPGDLGDAFSEVFAPTVLMTTMLGGTVGGGMKLYDALKGIDSKGAQKILSDPNSTPAQKAKAAAIIGRKVAKKDPDAAAIWEDHVKKQLDNGDSVLASQEQIDAKRAADRENKIKAKASGIELENALRANRQKAIDDIASGSAIDPAKKHDIGVAGKPDIPPQPLTPSTAIDAKRAPSEDIEADSVHSLMGEMESMTVDLTEGGGITDIIDDRGKVTGRTPSANPRWYQDMQVEGVKGGVGQPRVKAVQRAIDKLKAGKKLTGNQPAIIEYLKQIAGENLQDVQGASAATQEDVEASGIPGEIIERGAIDYESEEMAEPAAPPTDIGALSIIELREKAESADLDAYERVITDAAKWDYSKEEEVSELQKIIKKGVKHPAKPPIEAKEPVIEGKKPATEVVEPVLKEAVKPGLASKATPEAPKTPIDEAKPVVKPTEEIKLEQQEKEKAEKEDKRKAARAEAVRAKAEAPGASIDVAVKAAATHPESGLPEPTGAQKEAGTYKKGRVSINGMNIAVENPAGSKRTGIEKGEAPWSIKMKDHYGDFKRTTGAEGQEGEGVDVFINSEASDSEVQSRDVFVIDQKDKDGVFDEHKSILGAKSSMDAKRIYKRNYEKGWTQGGKVTRFTWDEFKEWSADPKNTKKPAAISRRKIAEPKEKPVKKPVVEPKKAIEPTQKPIEVELSIDSFPDVDDMLAHERLKALKSSDDVFIEDAVNQGAATLREVVDSISIWAEGKPKKWMQDKLRHLKADITGKSNDYAEGAKARRKHREVKHLDDQDPVIAGVKEAIKSRTVIAPNIASDDPEITHYNEVTKGLGGLLSLLDHGVEVKKAISMLVVSDEAKSQITNEVMGNLSQSTMFDDRVKMGLLDKSTIGTISAADDVIAANEAVKPAINVLSMTERQYTRAMAKKRGLKPKSPGYSNALADLGKEYETELDKSEASMTFEEYNKRNSDIPESINRQAHDQLKAEYASKPSYSRTQKPINKDNLSRFESKIKSKYGLEKFDIALSKDGIELSMIQVPKEKRKAGVGTKVMDELISFADQYDSTIWLSVADRNDAIGTTSKNRLKKFYRKFGFVENKGRNKDYRLTIYANMYRKPRGASYARKAQKPTGSTAQLTKSKDQSDAKLLEKAIAGYFQDLTYEYTQVELPDALSGIEKAYQQAFSKRITAIEPGSGKANFFNGVRIPSNPDVLYINAEQDVSWISVAGHELYHDLAKSRPDLHKYLTSNIRAYYKDFEGYRARLERRYKTEESLPSIKEIEEELLADITGDALSDPKFLASLAKDNPGKFKRLLGFIRRWLALTKNKPKGLGSEAYVTDMESVRAYLRQAVKAYSDGGAVAIEKVGKPDFMVVESQKESRKPFTESDYRPEVVSWAKDKWGEKDAPNGQSVWENFVDWFGSSGVTNPDGTPMVVYHGTSADIQRFSNDTLGRNTAAASAGQGHFFAESPKTAGVYTDAWSENKMAIIEELEKPLKKQFALVSQKIDRLNKRYNKQEESIKQEYIKSYKGPRNKDGSIPKAKIKAELSRQYDLLDIDALNNDRKRIDEQLYSIRSKDFEKTGAVIYPVYLKITNPLVHDFKKSQYREETFNSLLNKAKEQNKDGAIFQNIRDGAQYDNIYIAFEGGQIKSTNNKGDFSEDERIAYSRGEKEEGKSEQSRKYENVRQVVRDRVDAFRFQMQDKLIDLKREQEKIEKETGPLADEVNPYQKAAIWEGKAGERLNDFDEDSVQPLLEKMAETDKSIEEIGEWLVARHAEEANAYLYEINQDMEDETRRSRLSGMSNGEAKTILAASSGNQSLQEIGVMIDKINQDRVSMLVSEGLIAQGMADAWQGRYKHYVPLKREEAASLDLLPSRGRGFDLKGKESKKRTGSAYWTPSKIVTNTVAQAEASIVRAEKNQVDNALLLMVEQNPDDSFWSIQEDATRKDVRNKKVIDVPKMFDGPNEITVKRNGEDVVIEFNIENAKAMRLASGLKNLNAAQLGGILGGLSKVNRYLSQINTTWNPEFALSNFAKDVQTAGYNLSNTEISDMTRQVLKDIPRALKGIKSALMGDSTAEWSPIWEDFRKHGGKTGWIDLHGTLESKERNLARLMGRIRSGKNPKTLFRRVFDKIDDINAIIENGVRLSAYKNALDQGMTKDKAAALAKDLTVNFNRKGNMGPAMNSLYMFYNASAQGSVRLLQTMAHSKKGRALAGGTVGFAIMLDMLNRALSDDDDDGKNLYDALPDYVKAHNLILMGEKEPLVKIPLPWGYNVLHTIGQAVGEALSGERFNAMDATAHVGNAMIDAFNPVGSGSLLQVFAPTVLDPAVQIAENKNFAGIPVKPEQSPFGPPKPESEMYFRSARESSKSIASWLNNITDGNEYRPGVVNISPEWIDLGIDYVTGGAGRTVMNATDTAQRLVQGKELATKNIPFVRKITGYDSAYGVKSRYYELSKDVAYAKKEEKHLKGPALERAKKNPAFKLIRRYNSAEKQLRKLRKDRRVLVSRNASENRIKSVDKRIRGIMARFNRAYVRVTSGNQ